MKYVGYFRVSTKQQGQSGLGLEAQKAIVQGFLKPGDELIAELVEVESGKRNDRPKLREAIDLAKAQGATLLIAKLDRLSRNAAFIFALRDSAVEFKACDLPDANTLTIGIFATLAQHERELISQRTKAALAAKKARGEDWERHKLTDEQRAMGRQARSQQALESVENKRAAELARLYRAAGKGYKAIAETLNRNGHRTRNGKEFKAMTVKRLLVMPFLF